MKAFTDSGGWLSVLIETDKYHSIGKAYFEKALDQRATLETTDFVLDEVVTRLRYDVSHSAAVRFIDLVREAEFQAVLAVHSITRETRERAEAIFRQYKDTKLSFTDCTSFAFLEAHPADEVFGFDTHFEMMGFLLKPKLSP
jgi:predicted nucleic acid-binding protein